jgi:uncharacterized membrane protein YphA (DoxX/SURF4 family)
MKAVAFIARISFSLVFLAIGVSDFWDGTIAYAASQGISLPDLFIPLSGMFSLLSALFILFGYKAKLGAWLIILFVLPVAFMTDKFWLAPNLDQMALHLNDFIKDMSMIGGASLFAYFGAGPLSFDAKPRQPFLNEQVKTDFTYDIYET